MVGQINLEKFVEDKEKNEDDIDMEFNDDIPDSKDEEVSEDTKMTKPFDPTKINILPKQDVLRNLIDRLRNNEIDMSTDFQRHPDLWKPDKMSRFIESILIRLPLPPFYFDATNDDVWLVVDGLQRLSSVRAFVIEKKLRLINLEYLAVCKGKTYEELSRTYQRRIDECPVTLFNLKPGTPSEVRYSIFRRINTGGLVLNNQEIRNALAGDPLRKFFNKITQNKYLLQTIGNQDSRMIDQELILRFLAFYEMNYEQTSKNIAQFLDDMMEKLKKKPAGELDNLKRTFENTIERCWNIFGENAFEKKTESHGARRRKNSTLFEVWTVALAKLSDDDAKTLIAKKTKVQEKHLDLMKKDNEYFRSITYSTQKREHFRIRRDKVQQIIKEVLGA